MHAKAPYTDIHVNILMRTEWGDWGSQWQVPPHTCSLCVWNRDELSIPNPRFLLISTKADLSVYILIELNVSTVVPEHAQFTLAPNCHYPSQLSCTLLVFTTPTRTSAQG